MHFAIDSGVGSTGALRSETLFGLGDYERQVGLASAEGKTSVGRQL
jgi:hypothetical protein